jgi:tRNA nucleotidyltransferase (CCA-adding enzyme)
VRIVTLLDSNDFTVNDSRAWSDEKEYVIFMVEVESRYLNPGKVHAGPKVSFADEADNFLKKHLANDKILAGPYIREGRWYVEIRREQVDAKTLLIKEIPTLKLSRDIAAVALRGFTVLVDEDLGDICRKEGGVMAAFLKLVRKTPPWLR